MSQDAEVGDGTTSVVLLAGEFLRECKPYIEEGMHPQTIVKAYREACAVALKKLGAPSARALGPSPTCTPCRPYPRPKPRHRPRPRPRHQLHLHPRTPTPTFTSHPHPHVSPDSMAVHLDVMDPAARNDMLLKSAATSLSSKLVSGHKEFFAKMVVDAVNQVDGSPLGVDMIGMKKARTCTCTCTHAHVHVCMRMYTRVCVCMHRRAYMPHARSTAARCCCTLLTAPCLPPPAGAWRRSAGVGARRRRGLQEDLLVRLYYTH